MSSRVWGKNTSLPRICLRSVASAGCAPFARLCLVPRAPAFPMCTVEGSPWRTKEQKGLGDKEGHSPGPRILHLMALEL